MNLTENSYMIFDIETYKDLSDTKYLEYKSGKITAPSNYKDQAKIDAYIEEKKIENQSKLALSPYTANVITIGFKTPTETQVIFYVNDKELKEIQDLRTEWIFCNTEKILLETAIEIINDALDKNCTLVTFNGKSFDLPFIFTRAIIQKVSTPIKDYPELIHNYRHDRHLDLTSFFDKGSLNSLAYLTGEGDLYDEKGNAIDKYYSTKDYTSIYEKISKDLNKTEAIYKKIKAWVPQRQSYY